MLYLLWFVIIKFQQFDVVCYDRVEIIMKIKEGFVLEGVGSSYLAVAVGERAKDFSGLVRMNSTGAFLWNLLAKSDMKREDLIEATLKEYDAPIESITDDVDAFIQKLSDSGIIE